ncbi:hypothetical protein AAG570_006318 [Ranatra chinensis]|uniref:Uncharacterized protein n=1 Tax=Ranatra chinensis TaxID=642074 RepID=A0ABD0Z487_9HEMI
MLYEDHKQHTTERMPGYSPGQFVFSAKFTSPPATDFTERDCTEFLTTSDLSPAALFQLHRRSRSIVSPYGQHARPSEKFEVSFFSKDAILDFKVTRRVQQCLRIVDLISSALEKKEYCGGVFLDVAQAFDRSVTANKLRVFMHDPRDIGFMSAISQGVLRPGKRLEVVYSSREVVAAASAERLTEQGRACRMQPDATYSKSICMASCNATAQARICNCTHHLLPRQGDLSVDFMDEGLLINAKCRKKYGGVFQLHNARHRSACVTQDLLVSFGWDIVTQTPYFPELAP